MSVEKLHDRGPGEQNLILVHPFYHETDGSVMNDPGIQRMTISYNDKIEALVRGIDRERFRVVLNDTRSGFARKTHSWQDEGLLDAVYLDPDGFRAGCEVGYKAFRDSKRNFVAGAYGGRCLNDVMSGIRVLGKAPLFSFVAVRDAIMYRDTLDWLFDIDRVKYTLFKSTTVQKMLQ